MKGTIVWEEVAWAALGIVALPYFVFGVLPMAFGVLWRSGIKPGTPEHEAVLPWIWGGGVALFAAEVVLVWSLLR